MSGSAAYSSVKYSIPWSAMLPIAGMTFLVGIMRPMVDWHSRTFYTEGQPVRKAMDYFDYVMAERDIKITGSMYRQQSHTFK